MNANEGCYHASPFYSYWAGNIQNWSHFLQFHLRMFLKLQFWVNMVQQVLLGPHGPGFKVSQRRLRCQKGYLNGHGCLDKTLEKPDSLNYFSVIMPNISVKSLSVFRFLLNINVFKTLSYLADEKIQKLLLVTKSLLAAWQMMFVLYFTSASIWKYSKTK